MASMNCCKCKSQAALHSGYCGPCWAEYMRAYRAGQAKRQKTREFIRGVAAMRDAAAQTFRRAGDKDLNGYAAARIVETITL